MAVAQDIKERIFAAADAIHAASSTGEYPNVEAVRQSSRAGMNNVVEAMKEWRQNQRKQVQAVREPLPLELHSVVQGMGQSFWETAQQLANESLDAARIAFETEKSDLVQLSVEQSEAFEAQGQRLEMVLQRVDDLEQQLQASGAAALITAQQLEQAHRDRVAVEQKAALAEQKAEEVERRATELRSELNHAHVDAEAAAIAAKETADTLRIEVDRLRSERDKAQERHELAVAENARLSDRLGIIQTQAMEAQSALASSMAKAQASEEAFAEQRKQFAQEAHRTAERMTKAKSERDNARTEVASAREEAATLRGHLEATKTQNATLLEALNPASKGK